MRRPWALAAITCAIMVWTSVPAMAAPISNNKTSAKAGTANMIRCAPKFQKALDVLATKQRTAAINLKECGEVFHEVTSKPTALFTRSGTVCRTSGQRNLFGGIQWMVETCESWSWDGSSIINFSNPPTARYRSIAPWSVSVTDRGAYLYDSDDWGKAWADYRVAASVLGVELAAYSVNHAIHFSSSGQYR
jgi:hypothetical protein